VRRWLLLAVLVSTSCRGAGAPLPPTTLAPTLATTRGATSTTVQTATTVGVQKLDVAAWREDLNALISNLEELHPNPWWRVTKDTFLADVADVSARLPRLTSDQATLEIVRLAAEIDGHTQVFVGYLGWDFARIQLYAFQDGIGVAGASDPSLVGGRLIAVGHTPAEEAFDLASVLASYDNPETRAFTTPFLLAVPRLLAGLGIDDEDPTYTIQKVDGESVTVTPETGTFDQYRSWFGDPVIGLPQSDLMPYLARKTTPFWWTVLDDGSVYLQYNQVTRSGLDPSTGAQIALGTLVEQVGAALDAAPQAALIVDIRHNLGGDNQTYAPLLSMLTDRFSDSCGLYVITGRATFSAAVNFATEVEQQTTAVFIGEPTGGSPNLYGDVTTVTLPNSHIQVRISTRYWEFGGPDDHRISIEPAIPAPPTLADWNAGRDTALEAVPSGRTCSTP